MLSTFNKCFKWSQIQPFQQQCQYIPSQFFSQQNEHDPYFSQKMFKDLDIDKELKKIIAKQDFKYLTKVQEQSLEHTLKGKNCLIQSETGSGKTLSYVLPILNQLTNPSLNPKSNPQMRGALVLAPTKDLCAQIYSVFRLLDYTQKFRISRLGSLATYSPITQFQGDNREESFLQEVAHQSLVRSVTWNNLDVLISTPVQLSQILAIKNRKSPLDINPRTVVIDEYDLLFGDNNIAKATKDILSKFVGRQRSPFADINHLRQFILAGATAPQKIGGVDLQQEIENWFVDLNVVKTQEFQQISERLDFKIVRIPEFQPDADLNLLKQLIDQYQFNKMIIFCQSSERVKKVISYLKENKIKCLGFYASLTGSQRIESVARFNDTEQDYNILVSTDLVARGMDFNKVDHIIQFDFAKDAVSLMHRIGRTARCGKQGTVTSFVREPEEFFASKFSDVLRGEAEISDIYSHKRSLSKRSYKN